MMGESACCTWVTVMFESGILYLTLNYRAWMFSSVRPLPVFHWVLRPSCWYSRPMLPWGM